MNAELNAMIQQLPRSHDANRSGEAMPVFADSVIQEFASAGLISRSGYLAAAHAVETGFWLGAWVLVGVGALDGRLDTGWIAGWALCMLTTIPLRSFVRASEGSVAIGLGKLIRQRLFRGATVLDAEMTRTAGAGKLVGEILEADSIDISGASGGFEAALALVELLICLVLFSFGVNSLLQILALTGSLLVALVLSRTNASTRVEWTDARLHITRLTVENMVGHRTRLAQEKPSRWHYREDHDLREYAARSQKLDHTSALLQAMLPRAYLVIAVAALAASFIQSSNNMTQQAISLGTLLFAAGALERFTYGLTAACSAWVSWQIISEILVKAENVDDGMEAVVSAPDTGRVIFGQDLTFFQPGRIEPTLSRCSLAIEKGDLLLCEGGSGSGKSTLAKVLAGFVHPAGGILLSGGLDRHVLGSSRWRRRVVLAPQYHENHIFSAPLYFNLLLGRSYPFSQGDLEDAREICQQIGLGELIASMPAGLDQIVGDTGWQLSQGERSRVFLARAILQNSELTMLDESLAALDPENLERCLECVLKKCKTLMVIAHP
jgi:ATP-binding cassette subfamily B protein